MEGVPEKEFKKFFKGCYNKKTYKTRKRAEDFIDYQYKKFDKKTKVYECEYCGNYHLTSKLT